MILAAPAKVNLFLEILNKRTDGFHNLETLILAVNLFDTLELHASPIPDELALTCSPGDIPNDSRNLVWKAAEALRQECNVNYGATLHLTKRIPHEAGLGGGSSDAALTLLGLNHLWQLNLSLDQLNQVAARLGSDIGAFLALPASWCTGRGEIVEAETPGRELHLVIVKPPVGLSTKSVYQRVQVPTSPQSGHLLRQAFRDGNPSAIASQLHNRLQEPAFEAEPVVQQVFNVLQQCQPLGVLLSGSGSCVFAVCSNSHSACQVAERFRELGPASCLVFVVRSLLPMALFPHRHLQEAASGHHGSSHQVV